jgi:hypothetical protein
LGGCVADRLFPEKLKSGGGVDQKKLRKLCNRLAKSLAAKVSDEFGMLETAHNLRSEKEVRNFRKRYVSHVSSHLDTLVETWMRISRASGPNFVCVFISMGERFETTKFEGFCD